MLYGASGVTCGGDRRHKRAEGGALFDLFTEKR